MSEDKIDYASRAQAALLGVVRDVIADAAENGLVGEHHFYITYRSNDDGVVMSDKLRASHPLEITIVLQNQFEELSVTPEQFSVRLSFNQQPETLVVPFSAITKFYDPSVAFGLMFEDEDFDPDDEAYDEDLDAEMEDQDGQNIADMALASPPSKAETPDKKPAGEVISLDSFRDK
jgi:hypothetical protein